MKIEFVIPCYERIELLHCIIWSIIGQTNKNWKIHVVIDREDSQLESELLDIYKPYYLNGSFKVTTTGKRYNDFGHTPRNIGLLSSDCEWVVLTGEDNYYAPVFVDEFLKEADKETCFVYCNMVHNWQNNDYIPIACRLESGGVFDIGCYMIKPSLLKGAKLDIQKEEIADYYFAKQYLNLNRDKKIKHINKIMYVHN
jgi:hypothetical protein